MSFWRALGSAAAWLPAVLLAAGVQFSDVLNGAELPVGLRGRALTVPSTGRTGFTRMETAATGVLFTNSLAADRSITNHVLLNGSGLAAGDVDGDGWVDLYFCGLDGPNELYRNRGNWQFENVTTAAGVACPGLDATGAAFADLDGDVDLDLVVNTVAGGTHLFFNDGHGRFTPAAPMNAGNAGTSLALADMDGDGALDLYIANYRPMFFFLDKPETRYSVRNINGQPRVAMIDGRPLTDPEFTNRFVFQLQIADGKVTLGKEELGQVDGLYRNDGKGTFSPVSWTSGAFLDEDGSPLKDPPRDWGLSVTFRDLNHDGSPDLYICNDFRTPDRIWLNNGRGQFRALPRTALRSTCLSAMGVDVADVNRDGFFDLFVVDMLGTDSTRRRTERIDLRPEPAAIGQVEQRPQYSRNMLQLSRGDGTFAEIAQLAGLEASDWTWSPIFLDVDLDGLEDLIVANGFERDTMSVDAQKQFEILAQQQKLTGLERLKLRKLYPRLDTPNLAFRNQGDGTFSDVSNSWSFNATDISQGMCLADLDNDGDLDVAINNFNGPAGLYRNDAAAPRIAIQLKGGAPNTHGVGATIELLGGPHYQSQEMICGGRYCSSDAPMRTFAAGGATNPLRLVVTWRNGRRSVVEQLQPNWSYEIDEASAKPGPAPARPSSLEAPRPWLAAEAPAVTPAKTTFQDVSSLLHHPHHEELFDDFQRQPLLPVRLSQPGPPVCWFDLDLDGWDDLMVGTGRGGRGAVFRNLQGARFELMTNAWTRALALRDQTAILGIARDPKGADLLIAQASYEDGQVSTSSVMHYHGRQQSIREAVPGSSASVGALALADVDGDSDLDLFVAGRVIPGRYPEPASSRLFRQDQGQWKLDAENTQALERVGLVTGAVWSDLDGNGQSDLVLACEWGPIRVFQNRSGRLSEITQALGLDRFRGWWNGVTAGDFDGDGRLDIAASNWGRNTRYQPSRQNPLRLYYGDFNGDGSVQTLEAYTDPATQRWVPWRRLDDVSRGLPFLNAAFANFQQFAKADIPGILGDKLRQATILEATCLESTLFLNRRDHFEAAALPLEAQIAPAFAICAGDLDGDGHEDLFLSQNFFAVQTEMSRYDAGRSLWLRGNGRGQFESVSGSESGLLVYGEQRGAALCDYDADGRVDLVVGQNGAATRLFRNQTARPGMRVRLKGPPGNPDAVGAVLRLKSSGSWGPAREIHVGSGYASQDAVVQVLARPEGASELEVRWPGGVTTKVPVPDRAREIEVSVAGTVRQLR